MITINLRDFYYWYATDEFIEVSDEVAEELIADKRYEKTYERIQRRYNVLSLDMEDGTTEIASILSSDRPEVIIELIEQRCQLCHAINSLPTLQGRRIEARYIHGIDVVKIAKSDGVNERRIRKSIKRGLKSMKYFLINFEKEGAEKANICPDI